jgi:hypothetical protein
LALFLEVPFAIVLFWVTWRSVRELFHAMSVAGDVADVPVRKIRLTRRFERVAKPGSSKPS